MCAECQKGETATFERTMRLKLWEIDSSYHCTIIGTCLSLRELRRIAKRAGIELKSDATEYAIHVTFVNYVEQHRDVAKLMHKALDRKYRSAVDSTKRFECLDELMDYWRSNLKSGRVPGAYWATMSHRLIDQQACNLVFGDVHMLSHMIGAANRADLKRLDELEQRFQSLSVAREEEKVRNRKVLTQRNAVIAELQAQLADYKRIRGRLVALEAQLAQYKDASIVDELTRKCEQLEEDHSKLRAAFERSRAAVIRHEVHHQSLLEENATLKRGLQETQREADHLEHLLKRRLAGPAKIAAGGAKSAPVDLDGATVIYVGGRTSQISHFRSYVEQANGSFLHHDGGLEDGDSRLPQILSRGDIVMCPMDCVSHSACWRAKTYCRRAGKCFVPLRSSGLSSFVTGLKDLKEAD